MLKISRGALYYNDKYINIQSLNDDKSLVPPPQNSRLFSCQCSITCPHMILSHPQFYSAQHQFNSSHNRFLFLKIFKTLMFSSHALSSSIMISPPSILLFSLSYPLSQFHYFSCHRLLILSLMNRGSRMSAVGLKIAFSSNSSIRLKAI